MVNQTLILYYWYLYSKYLQVRGLTHLFSYTVPKLVGLPDINYSGLHWLCGIEGLGERYVIISIKLARFTFLVLYLIIRSAFFVLHLLSKILL